MSESADDFRTLSTQYLESLQARGYSTTTVVKYRYVLSLFVEWSRLRGLAHPPDIDLAALEELRDHLARKLRPSTVADTLTIIRGFFRFLFRRGVLVHNPADALEPGQPERRHRLPLSHAHIERLLAQVDVNDHRGLHDRAMIELLYSSALRVSELCALTFHDVDATRGLVFVRSGKGNRDRVVPVGERALKWLDRYLREARPSLLRAEDPAVLFLNTFGGPIGRQRVTDLIRRYAAAAQLERPASSHILRHTTATVMLERGADTPALQELLGHQRLTTTQYYASVAITDLKAVHARTHPAEQHQEAAPRFPKDKKRGA